MPKKTFTFNQFLGINNVKDSRDIADHELTKVTNMMFDKQGAMRTAGQFTDYTTTNLSGDASNNAPGGGLFYFEGDRTLEDPTTFTTDTTFPTQFFPSLADYEKATFTGPFTHPTSGETYCIMNFVIPAPDVDYFNIGDKIMISGSDAAGTNRIKTLLYKVSIAWTEPGPVPPAGTYSHEAWRFSGTWSSDVTLVSTTFPTITKLNSISGEKVWIKPKEYDSPTYPDYDIMVWNSSDTNWASHSILTTTTSSNHAGVFLPKYYYADLALRVSDANLENTGTIKWFGFIDRTHFENEPYLGWFTKDNNLAAPTESRISSSYPATAELIYWDIDTSTPGGTDPESEWVDADYECAMSFIYDGVQESLLYDMADSAGTSVFNVPLGDVVTVEAKSLSPFNERISGARLYCRAEGSDDEWSFLAELDLSKGIKTSLSSNFKGGWTAGGANEFTSELVTSLRQNLDTYQSINGFESDIDSVALGLIGENWKTACVSNRRVFVANVSAYNSQSESNIHYCDRILYSEIGKYDTFPSHNYIDVVKGDAEEYVALLEYGDRLMAFKHNTLFILNIANPSPTAWFLEKTFKYKGIKHPEAAFRTEDGVVWVNEAGCWVYNGEQIINLIDNKIDTVQSYISSDEHQYSWKDFYTENSIVGYSPKYKQILVLRDCSGAGTNAVFLYDIKTQSWTYIRDATTLFGNVVYSNFILDGDGELAIMTTGGDIRYYDPESVACNTEFTTKFIDLGFPNNIKKIYKVAVTYKSSVTQTEPLTCRYIDKAGAMVNSAFAVDQFDPVTLAVKSNWEVAVFTPVSSLTCQSIQFKMRFPSSGTIDINEIMVYYRTKRRVVKN